MLCEEERIYQFFSKIQKAIHRLRGSTVSRPRITLMGDLKISKNSVHKKRFLNRHPTARLYSDFADMNFYILDIKAAHLIGGFAQVNGLQKTI